MSAKVLLRKIALLTISAPGTQEASIANRLIFGKIDVDKPKADAAGNIDPEPAEDELGPERLCIGLFPRSGPVQTKGGVANEIAPR